MAAMLTAFFGRVYFFFTLIHTRLYPHETHKHDKFEKNNQNAKIEFC